MLEIEIPIPDDSDGNADWSICQQAWWAVIESVYSEKNMRYCPMRTTLEMRVMGGSDILMAPQYGNKRTCAIEVLTPAPVDENEWKNFIQEILDKWVALTDDKGHYLNIRPHWAKRFDGLVINRESDPQRWENYQIESIQEILQAYTHGQRVSMPMAAYLKEIAYKNQIAKFVGQLTQICQEGGYELSDLACFSNTFLDYLIFNEPLHSLAAAEDHRNDFRLAPLPAGLEALTSDSSSYDTMAADAQEVLLQRSPTRSHGALYSEKSLLKDNDRDGELHTQKYQQGLQ